MFRRISLESTLIIIGMTSEKKVLFETIGTKKRISSDFPNLFPSPRLQSFMALWNIGVNGPNDSEKVKSLQTFCNIQCIAPLHVSSKIYRGSIKGSMSRCYTVEILITHSVIPGRNVMHYCKYARLRYSHSPEISGWLFIQQVSEALQQALQR